MELHLNSNTHAYKSIRTQYSTNNIFFYFLRKIVLIFVANLNTPITVNLFKLVHPVAIDLLYYFYKKRYPWFFTYFFTTVLCSKIVVPQRVNKNVFIIFSYDTKQNRCFSFLSSELTLVFLRTHISKYIRCLKK